MIGFPLQLPLEATADRNFYLAEISCDTLIAGTAVCDRDCFVQFKIDVTPQEAVALATWLKDRGAAAEARLDGTRT
ncbi:MAG: hypothetical protein Q7V20_23015 [Aquabacterium sp.]|uniref:hypothetical protein n=1 Tax=Aquabacterium sp. TaxID=1872578 RepID=UPI0027236A91|nr:hypothetical protein [Aquabacterium sp.]MDO9006325.1 hypothetical protein [Aquabacterium sp.]